MEPEIKTMKDTIISLAKQHKKNAYLQNVLSLKCGKCHREEKITYYELLSRGEFSIRQPLTTLSPFIAEYFYDEMVTVTPILITRKCQCGADLEEPFPVALECLITMLQVEPPDSQIYA